MLINNTEALKGWLVVILEPLCDADSSALARYVLALLKKDKPERELKRVMIEQLDVFLAEETKPFVDGLFAAIRTEEYLKIPQVTPPQKLNTDMKKTTTTNNDVTTTAASSIDASDIQMVRSVDNVKKVIKQENGEPLNYLDASKIRNVTSTTTERHFADKNHTPPIEDNKTKDVRIESSARIVAERTLSPSHRQSAPTQQQPQFAGHYHHYHGVSTKCSAPSQVYGNMGGGDRHQQHRSASPPPMARASVADKENQPRESRRRRASLRSRSRSRSNERLSRRSRSRDRRVSEREKSQRQFRNKSPPNGSGGGGGDNRHDRRRGGGNRRMVAANAVAGSCNIEDRSPRLGNDRKTSGLSAGATGRSVNRSSNSPCSRSSSQERAIRNKRSPSVGRNQVKSSFTNAGGSPETRHHHHENTKRQRCRDFDEKGYCVRGETCPWDHGVNPVVFEGLNNPALISMSLREYNPDAPDLWARTAPSTAAIVAGASGGSLMTGPAASAINPFTGSARSGAVMLGGHTGHVGYPPVPGTEKSSPSSAALSAADYARTAASAFRAAAPMIPFPFNPSAVATPLQRELIPIPVVDASGGGANSVGGDITVSLQGANKRRYELEDSVAIGEGPSKRKIPAHSRLGPRLPSMQNCSLELRKVPRGLNTIAHLNNHFAKFGKIVNIQISYDNDPEAAIITFSTHAEANVAYRSTEAVLNNRFIKVFWHSSPSTDSAPILGSEGNTILGGGHPIMGGVRKNSQYHLNNIPAVMPIPTADSAKITNTASQSQAGDANNNVNAVASSAIANNSNVTPQDSTSSSTNGSTSNISTTTTTTTVVAATHVQPPSLRLKNNIAPRVVAVTNAIIRKKQEEQVKAVAQLANGLRKRKQELLQSYVKQVKTALELIERCEPSDPQRSKTLDTIKVLQTTIDKLRKEIAAEQEQIHAQIQNQQAPTVVPVKKTKEQQKKELLDIELELFAQQQEGNDTTAIQKRLEELQRNLGIVSGSASPIATLPPTGNLITKSPHYIASGRANARLRATYLDGSTRVDRRPKTIIVTGFTKEEADSVLAHLKHFGEITKHDMDVEKPQLIVSYAIRNNAEQALSRGKIYKDKCLQIIWAPIIPSSASPAATSGAVVGSVGNKTITATNLTEQKQQQSQHEQEQHDQDQVLKEEQKLETKTAETESVKDPKKAELNTDTGIVWQAYPSPTYSPVINEIESNATDTDILPELRLEDEEEEEESEDRSWRR